MLDRIMEINIDTAKADQEFDLLVFVQAMSATHGATLERLLSTQANDALVSQALENIGNRYLGLSRAIKKGSL